MPPLTMGYWPRCWSASLHSQRGSAGLRRWPSRSVVHHMVLAILSFFPAARLWYMCVAFVTMDSDPSVDSRAADGSEMCPHPAQSWALPWIVVHASVDRVFRLKFHTLSTCRWTRMLDLVPTLLASGKGLCFQRNARPVCEFVSNPW